MFKNILRGLIVASLSVLGFVLGQIVWVRFAPPKVLPNPISIGELKPNPKKFLPQSIMYGEYVDKQIVVGGQAHPLTGPGVVGGKIISRLPIDGFVEIRPDKLTQKQKIHLTFYHNQDFTRGIIASKSGEIVVFKDDPTKTRYPLNLKLKFGVSDPSGKFWVYGNHPEYLKVGDTIQITKTDLSYYAPLLGSASGTAKIIKREKSYVHLEIGEERIPVIVNSWTSVYDNKDRLKKISFNDIPTITKVNAMYYLNDAGYLITVSLGINYEN